MLTGTMFVGPSSTHRISGGYSRIASGTAGVRIISIYMHSIPLHTSLQHARDPIIAWHWSQELTSSDGVDAEKIVARHIRLLHMYNEAKDATQVLIGRVSHPSRLHTLQALPTLRWIACLFFMWLLMRKNQLATLRGTTVRGVHEELGLGLGED